MNSLLVTAVDKLLMYVLNRSGLKIYFTIYLQALLSVWHQAQNYSIGPLHVPYYNHAQIHINGCITSLIDLNKRSFVCVPHFPKLYYVLAHKNRPLYYTVKTLAAHVQISTFYTWQNANLSPHFVRAIVQCHVDLLKKAGWVLKLEL